MAPEKPISVGRQTAKRIVADSGIAGTIPPPVSFDLGQFVLEGTRELRGRDLKEMSLP